MSDLPAHPSAHRVADTLWDGPALTESHAEYYMNRAVCTGTYLPSFDYFASIHDHVGNAALRHST